MTSEGSETRLVRLGEGAKLSLTLTSLAGLLTPAMAWLLALVELVLEGRRLRGRFIVISPASKVFCKLVVMQPQGWL